MKQQYANEISHRGFCRTDKNYMRSVRGASVPYSETNCIKTLSGGSVSIRF
jgi:hypothetical protein